MGRIDRSCVSCFICLFLGIACLVIGLSFLLHFFPLFVKTKIEENLVLRNGTAQWDRFVLAPVPIYMKFYIFNVTNMDEVNNGEMAILDELGPYVYREEKFKEIIYWNESSGVLRYKERRTFYFEPHLSNGALSDKINHINPVAMAIVSKLEQIPFASVLIPHIGLNHKYVETHTVKDLLFEGYSIRDYFPSWVLINPCNMVDCTFGFYYGKNATSTKVYEISTGALGMHDYTVIKRFNEESKLPFWYGDTCNAINGTDGAQFPPGVDHTKNLYAFSDDLCRSFKLTYEKHVSVEGIEALHYKMPKSLTENPNQNSENMCFCHEDVSQPCPHSISGIFPLFRCLDGAPVALSGPHFYLSDPEFWRGFQGLNPEPHKHDSFLNIEPFTGQVVSAAKRLQVNIYVKQDSRIAMIPKNLNDTFFPAMWIEESGAVDDFHADEFKRLLTTPYKIGKWTLVSVAILGGLILLIIFTFHGCKSLPAKFRYNAVKREPDNVVKVEENDMKVYKTETKA